MSRRQRQSNDTKRRIAPPESLTQDQRDFLLKTSRYVGSAIHKRIPSDYGLHPPINPRPSKSLCDDRRSIPHAEARRLLIAGVRKGLVSTHRNEEGLPKYVWAVDAQGEVYEAKTGNEGYHGYRLDEATEDIMREWVLNEWKQR